MPAILPRFVFRAPLMPWGGADDPLFPLAVDLASPSLAAAKSPADARERYRRRASFRTTPHGLLAGVGLGCLGAATAIDTGAATPHATVSWERLYTLGRALLEDPAARRKVALRRAPSLLRHGDRIMWLSRDGQALEAELDEFLEQILAVTEKWTPWARVEKLAEDTILHLVDDGLLVSSLEPPLVGPPPLTAFLRALPAGTIRQALSRIARLLRAGRLDEARGLLESLPGRGGLHATLLFPGAQLTLDHRLVERAVALAPILVRLQEALAPPVAERSLHAASLEAIEAVTELFGAGALDIAKLACGGYGVTLGSADRRAAAGPPAPLLTLLLDRLATAGDEAHFTAAELDAVLPPAALPPSYEIFLTPGRQTCLLGLHAPAGASWGRFAHALGAPLRQALAALDRAEGHTRLDVDFAPRAELADLATHPAVRKAALALTGWPERALGPAELELVSDPGAREPLGLLPAVPSPLARLRSTTAPPGIYRLLTGWSLQRQHAPWAVTLGPLAQLARLPRLVIDGFVVAPASWRLPAADLPAWVQIGHEDELLPVERGSRELAQAGRAFEIWPPLDDTADRQGRRVEVVVAVVERLEGQARPVGRVETAAAETWKTYKIFGARDRQDRVLVEAIAPAIAAARRDERLDAWFFQRYVEGARHHLRLRVRGDLDVDLALAAARAAGDVVTVEITPYHRETARFGGPAGMAIAEKIFEQDSDLAIGLLQLDEDLDNLLVARFDALASGLKLPARRALAARRRAAEQAPVRKPDPRSADYRARQRRLLELLANPPFRARHPTPAHMLPTLLHLSAVRLVGPDRDREAHAYYLWERALESLAAIGTPSPGRKTSRPKRT